jgi:hypothetical protein
MGTEHLHGFLALINRVMPTMLEHYEEATVIDQYLCKDNARFDHFERDKKPPALSPCLRSFVQEYTVLPSTWDVFLRRGGDESFQCPSTLIVPEATDRVLRAPTAARLGEPYTPRS